ncbi:complement factor B-like [Engraulis encrasicolus]|uniref:complement factor B-like n=1 Tax=Engraulis encrasicolus TaxID=184585 RepID=UPI002FD1D248
MADAPLWTWVLWLVTLSGPVLGVLSDRDCSEQNLSIQDGHYTLSKGLSAGSVLAYHCPLGYYPPVATRRCQRNGEWDPPPKRSRRQAQCKLVRCPDPSRAFFQYGLVSPTQYNYYVGNITTYECYSNYELSGSAARLCKPNGKWNGSTPICSHNSEHCPDPGTPAGSQRTGDSFSIGDKVSYRCGEKGLILVGSQERVCKESGQWTGQEPECYYPYTLDTPDEISAIFSSSLESNLMTDMTGEQEGKKINVGQSGALHIYIALDASDSIDATTFNASKQIIIKLIEQISNYEVTPKYDIVVFTTKVFPVVNIANYYNNTAARLFEVIDQLEKFDYEATRDEAGTDITKAFHHIYSQISWIKAFDEFNFPKKSHVIIMFTDGESNMGGKPLPKIKQIESLVQGNKHEANNLDIYMFGVGEDIQKEELNSFATKREKHVFFVNNMSTLHETFDQMLDESNSVGLCGLHRDYAYSDDTDQAQKHPWLVQIKHKLVRKSRADCLGSLITPRFILTAAHCFSSEDTENDITVELSNKQKPVVKSLIRHEKYNIAGKKDKGVKEFYDYDVALIELTADIKFDKEIRPICIPCTKETSRALKIVGDDATCKTQKDTLLSKDNEQANFWSLKRAVTPQSKVQHVRKHAMIKLKKTQSLQEQPCFQVARHVENVTNYQEMLTERFLCTGGVEPETDHAACKGESGGALFLERHKRSIQVGIVSWGVSDICSDVKRDQMSNAKHRDFHISLFEVQPFLRKHVDSLEFI